PAEDTEETKEAAEVKPEDITGNLIYWTFTDNANNLVTEFNKIYPNVTVDLTVFGGDEYKTKILTTLQSGKDIPDLFDLEEGFVYEFFDSDAILDLSTIGIEDLIKDYYDFQVAGMKDSSGKIKGLSFQSSPVAFWHLRDACEQWLGTSDDKEISAMLSDWDSIIAKAKEVYEKSNGEVYLWPNIAEMVKVQAFSFEPLVRNQKLNVTDEWIGLIDDMRAMYQSGYMADLGSWSSEWSAAWNEGKLLFRAMPSWDFFTDWDKNKGNVGVAAPFESSYEGGTFISVYSETENLDAAKIFLEYIASDEFQKVNMTNYNQVPASLKVAEELANGFAAENFGGQNILKTYSDICANTVDITPDKYTRPVQNKFQKHASDGIKAGISNEEIIQNFKTEIRDLYPEVEITD
ncbi:MAG: extracellular solute-binding protein, partial [Clostridiales bacterium]|nr:extracellular solute-binding protein [Clostridiales bacterium]